VGGERTAVEFPPRVRYSRRTGVPARAEITPVNLIRFGPA
jgi:hypothetical protein